LVADKQPHAHSHNTLKKYADAAFPIMQIGNMAAPARPNGGKFKPYMTMATDQ